VEEKCPPLSMLKTICDFQTMQIICYHVNILTQKNSLNNKCIEKD
jgi:hypothetical protein